MCPGKGELSRPMAFAALPLSAGDLAGEGMQPLLPESPKLADPRVDILQRPRIHRVEPAGSFAAHSDKAALAQRPQMLRDTSLRDAELLPDHIRQTTRG